MNLRTLRSKQLFAAIMFVAATLVLAVQLITPSPVMVSVGENSANATQIGQYFTYFNVGIIAIAACLFGSSGTYLFLRAQDAQSAPPEHSQSQPNSIRPETIFRNDTNTTKAGEKELSGRRYETWENTVDRLRNNEEVVYTVILEADGEFAQRKIVEETDLSKATVSRTLDTLESKGLVERKRKGMGNTIILQ